MEPVIITKDLLAAFWAAGSMAAIMVGLWIWMIVFEQNDRRKGG